MYNGHANMCSLYNNYNYYAYIPTDINLQHIDTIYYALLGNITLLLLSKSYVN